MVLPSILRRTASRVAALERVGQASLALAGCSWSMTIRRVL
jgi:hypothetical protein